MSNINGILYVVATPIGNLGDMTPRAVEVLKSVDLILAEDTRHSRPLLQHFGIHTPCSAFHEYNEREKTETVCQRMLAGEKIALISDAGMPLVSDPGFPLVRRAQELGIKISPVPGASAALTALSISGLPSDRFVFEGFLPAKSKARRDYLETLKHEGRTLIFYESPRRVLETLQDMEQAFGPSRRAVLARELTKLHETVVNRPLDELVPFVEADENQQRGEIVLLVQGAEPVVTDQVEQSVDRILSVLLEELPQKQAVGIAVKLTGMKRNELYQRALELKQE